MENVWKTHGKRMETLCSLTPLSKSYIIFALLRQCKGVGNREKKRFERSEPVPLNGGGNDPRKHFL